MKPGFIIGVDPGFSGAIAILGPPEIGITPPLTIVDMPTIPGAKGKTELNYSEVLSSLTRSIAGMKTIMWLERVSAMPRQGVSSMFRFGQQFGALEMAAAANKHELHYVTPATWKSYFKLSADKGVARGEAIRRFPDQAHLFARVKDDGRAEAALIAIYGREHSK